MASRDITESVQDLTRLTWSERASSSGTAGTYLKAREGTGARMRYYKLSRFNGVAIDGHECVNEIVAARLMDLLGVEHLAYRLVHARVLIDGEEYVTWLNSSYNFRKAGERKQGLGTFYELHCESGEAPYDFCLRCGWGSQIHQMMVVDYLIANRDRHASNIEVLVDRAGKARLAPIFDNGFSLLAPYADDEELALGFDPLRRVGTTNFVGSRSLEENLVLAAGAGGIGELRVEDRSQLLAGLDQALPVAYLDKIWDIVWGRWQRYAEIRVN